MSVWNKMITALRGSLNEAGEIVMDSQALRILDQEVRDASEELKHSKDSLAAIIARQKLAEEKSDKLHATIEEHEGYAVKAIEKGDENLAHELATKIANLEENLNAEQSAAAEYKASADQLRGAIQSAERDIAQMKQQIDTVKATENVQRAQAAVSERHSGTDSKLRTAMDSLERIKERQALNAAQMKAAGEVARETGESSLDERLVASGIKTAQNSADKVLERLKSRNAT